MPRKIKETSNIMFPMRSSLNGFRSKKTPKKKRNRSRNKQMPLKIMQKKYPKSLNGSKNSRKISKRKQSLVWVTMEPIQTTLKKWMQQKEGFKENFARIRKEITEGPESKELL